MEQRPRRLKQPCESPACQAQMQAASRLGWNARLQHFLARRTQKRRCLHIPDRSKAIYRKCSKHDQSRAEKCEDGAKSRMVFMRSFPTQVQNSLVHQRTPRLSSFCPAQGYQYWHCIGTKLPACPPPKDRPTPGPEQLRQPTRERTKGNVLKPVNMFVTSFRPAIGHSHTTASCKGLFAQKSHSCASWQDNRHRVLLLRGRSERWKRTAHT